jgi:hypothetical protein
LDVRVYYVIVDNSNKPNTVVAQLEISTQLTPEHQLSIEKLIIQKTKINIGMCTSLRVANFILSNFGEISKYNAVNRVLVSIPPI